MDDQGPATVAPLELQRSFALILKCPRKRRAYQKVSPGWRTFVPIYLSVNCFIVSGPITFDFAHVMQHPSRQLHQRYGKRLS